jgi:hypothetical protein
MRRARRTQEKILRQRIVEIIGDESHNRFDPALPLEFLNRFEAKTLARSVRRQLENGRTIARDDNRLSPLDLARELRQAIFCFADGYRLHVEIVATCSYRVQDDFTGGIRRLRPLRSEIFRLANPPQYVAHCRRSLGGIRWNRFASRL